VGRQIEEALMFILISIQKSGTDMLSQALGIYDGPYLQIDGMVDPADIHPNQHVLEKLREPWPRGIARSHMHYDPAYLEIIKHKATPIVFAYRDPRDTIVSWMHWIKTRQAEGWFDLKGYRGDEQTIWDILEVSNFHFSRFLGWLEDPYVFSVQYEELVQDRIKVLGELSFYLGYSSASEMSRKIDPRTSTTFRKGVPGEWKKNFTLEMHEFFWEECYEIMKRMGYP
jgi:hypothetical protein